MDKFIDERDGQEYGTIEIGDQTWLSESFNFDIKNGSEVIETDHGSQRFYKWDAALRSVPKGWRIPTNADFSKLLKLMGGGYTEGALASSGRGGESAYELLKDGGSSNFNFRNTGFYADDEYFGGGEAWGYLWSSSESTSKFFRAKACVLFGDAVGMDFRDKNFMLPIRLIKGNQKPYIKVLNKEVQKVILELANCESTDERKHVLENHKNYNKIKNSEDVFIDERDFNVYSLIKKNGKVWLGENLRFKTNDSSAYNNYESNVFPFGYNYSHEESLKVLPEGFRLPSASEWEEICEEIPESKGRKNSKVSSTKGVSSINLLEAGWMFEGKSSWIGDTGFWWCQEKDCYVQLSRVSSKELRVVKDAGELLTNVKMPIRCLIDS